MQFQQLSAFKAVYELGTVTAAADFIHITQPAVSRLIASLERNVGFHLFQRVKGRLLPTDKGRAFYFEVAKAYSAIETLSDCAAEIKNSDHGSLHIAAFPMLSTHFLPTVLGNFLNKHPTIKTSLKTYRSEEVLRRTALQSCDIGFALLPEVTEGVSSITIECDCVCILPPNSTLATLPWISPSLLANQPLISCEKDHTQQQVDKIFKKEKVTQQEVAEVSLASAIATLVAEGVGASIVDPFSAQLATRANPEVSIKVFKPSISFRFYILLPLLRARSELVDLFINSFIEQAAQSGILISHKKHNIST